MHLRLDRLKQKQKMPPLSTYIYPRFLGQKLISLLKAAVNFAFCLPNALIGYSSRDVIGNRRYFLCLKESENKWREQ